MTDLIAAAMPARPHYDDAPKTFMDLDGHGWAYYDAYVAWCRACTTKKKLDKTTFDRDYYDGKVQITESRDPALQPDTKMAEGCCSAVSPCSHQQRSPNTLCNACAAAKQHGISNQASAASGLAGVNLSATLAERKTQHGDFTDHARCAVALKTVFDTEVRARIQRGQDDLTPTQLEAAHMILHKLARIVAGDANHLDHWHDIAGYATITAERIK